MSYLKLDLKKSFRFSKYRDSTTPWIYFVEAKK